MDVVAGVLKALCECADEDGEVWTINISPPARPEERKRREARAKSGSPYGRGKEI